MPQHEYPQHQKAVADLNLVAKQALAVLLTDHEVGYADFKAQQMLKTAAIDMDWTHFDRTVRDPICMGNSAERLPSVHIPAVARDLGQGWVDGTQSFGAVSIGCARLQAYLSQKGLAWCDTQVLQSSTVVRLLLAVPEHEQHTLGPTLLAGQLRAHVFDVTLVLHCDRLKVRQFMRRQRFAAVLISASKSGTLETLRRTIAWVRCESANIPVILGGNVLRQIPDICETVGADHIGNCVQDVIEVLGQTISTNDVWFSSEC